MVFTLQENVRVEQHNQNSYLNFASICLSLSGCMTAACNSSMGWPAMAKWFAESSILKRSFKELRTMIYLITSGTAHPNEPHF